MLVIEVLLRAFMRLDEGEHPNVNSRTEGEPSTSGVDPPGERMTRTRKRAASPYQSIKQQRFENEPYGNKPVTAIPGIGDKAAEKLKGAGITKASQLIGHLLVLDEDKEKFINFLVRVGSVTKQNANLAFNSCNAYINNIAS
ncbi:hypothetical protein GE061_015692 [Apolygus lucorum]|uniref:Uncharacterized protein n=1 Tax=Apolygus lucorum TaxID=248454 RepID=A0A8S9XNY7_APOLU|nr:hypothetical protein GE061_015692 [Apolygus lucorum]